MGFCRASLLPSPQQSDGQVRAHNLDQLWASRHYTTLSELSPVHSHSLPPSFVPAAGPLRTPRRLPIREPSCTAGLSREREQYGDAVRNGPHKLLPLVFETYGACGPELHRHLEAIREEEAWLDKHGLRGETLEMREKRLRLYKKAPFTARSHVNYWRQRFAVTNACGIANFINRAAQHLVLKNTL